MDENIGPPPDQAPVEEKTLADTPEPEAGASVPEPAPEPGQLAPEAAPEEAAPTPEPGQPAPEPASATAPPEPAAEPALLPAHGPEPLLLEGHEPEAPLPEEPPHATAEQVEPEHDHVALANAQRIESEIEALRTGHADGASRRFREFFEHERRIHALFKELRPLHPHDRHRLWRALKQAGADARRAQNEEWESRRYRSIEAREAVEEKLRAAEALMQTAADGAAYRRIESSLNAIRNQLGDTSPGGTGGLLIGPDRRACWDRWRAVREALRQRHGSRQEQSYAELLDPVADAVARAGEDDPFQVTQRIKELQVRLGKADLRRGQFEELRKRLSAAWLTAQGRMAEQRRERARQRAEWRGRMEQHLGRWRQTLEQRRGQLDHLVEQAAKLIEMEKRARSEDFAEQVRQWQAATAEKRRRTEESIAELEQRIHDTEKRTGGRRANAAGGEAAPAAGAAASDEGAPARPKRRRRGRNRKRGARAEATAAAPTPAEADAPEEAAVEAGPGPAPAGGDAPAGPVSPDAQGEPPANGT